MPAMVATGNSINLASVVRSVILPSDKLTLTDQKQAREAAIQAAVARYLNQSKASDPSELIVRAFENILDAGTALDQWLTAALAVVGTAYSCFQAVGAPVLANNKVAVFYGVGVEAVPFPVSLLTFRSGGIGGNIVAEFDLEQLVNAQQPEGYFAKPVIIDPTDTFAIQVTARVVAAASRIQLMGYIVEPKGQRISVQ